MSDSSTYLNDAAPTALVTGASSGIGAEIARQLAARGYRVLGTTRDPERLGATERDRGVEYLPLDLASEESIERCARAAGAIDLLVHNAGQSQIGPLEYLPGDSARRLFEINVLGPLALTRMCLPAMRARGGGVVILIGSLAAEFPVPFQAAYAATKSALHGLVLSLRCEVEPFGIGVTLLEPGDVRTGIQDRLERCEISDSAYERRVEEMSSRARAAVESAMEPDAVAQKVVSLAARPNLAPVYFVGALGAMQVSAKRVLTRRRVERLVARRYGLQ